MIGLAQASCWWWPGVLAAAPMLRAGAAVAALGLVAAGLFFLAGGRNFDDKPLDDRGANPPPPRTPLHAWREGLTRPSRTVVGLCLLLVGYHCVAYTNPQWPLLQVPIERWWVLALGVLLTMSLSLGADRRFP